MWSIREKTPYELLKGRKSDIFYFCIFSCKCFILNNAKDKLGKFDAKSDEWIFIGYSSLSKAYIVFNNRMFVLEEPVHVYFDKTKPQTSRKGILSNFNVSSIIIEELVKEYTLKDDPPKNGDIKDDKEDSEHE